MRLFKRDEDDLVRLIDDIFDSSDKNRNIDDKADEIYEEIIESASDNRNK